MVALIVKGSGSESTPYCFQPFLFQFSPDDSGQLLAVSSWEGTVRIYHFPAGPVTALEKRVYTHAKPVLACTFFVSYFALIPQ